MKDDHVKLTVLDLDFENKVAKTPTGMAHWAGTGPKGTTCRECSLYVFNGYASGKTGKGGVLKNGPCQRYLDSMSGTPKRIPFDTPSCKYFEQNDNPPSAFKKD